MHIIEDYKDYWIGFLGAAVTGGIVLALHPDNNDFPLIVEILLGMMMLLLFSFIIALPILAISWIFVREFRLFRFIRISVIVCVVMTLVQIISYLMGMR